MAVVAAVGIVFMYWAVGWEPRGPGPAPGWPKVASSIPSSTWKKAVFLSHRELLSQNV